MSDIYTRKGDGGETSLHGRARLPKDDTRIEALGDIDEAICAIGLARPGVIDNDLDALLEFVQQRLYNCSASMADAKSAAKVTSDDVAALERAIDTFTERIGGFQGFVLPGCDETSARLHLARAIVRRAERSVVRASHKAKVGPNVPVFLNRASDLLYVAARYIGAGNECAWRPDAEAP